MDNKLKGFRDTFLEKIKGFFSVYMTAEKTVPDQSIIRRLNYAAKGLGLGLMAFFLGRSEIFFSAAPFGAALLSAAGKYTPFIYIGLITSSLFSSVMAIPFFLMYSMGLILRFIISYWLLEKKRSPLFAEPISYRALCATVMMFMMGVYRCISGGFLWYDFIGTLLGMLTAPLLSLLYCGVFIKKYRYTSYNDLGLAALMASCIFSVRDVSILGFSLCAVIAFGISLYISKECGMLRGGIAGLIAGLAYNVFYAPLFALSGLLSGLFWRVGALAATAIALVCGIFYGIYMDGFASLQALAPDLLAGALIFTLLAHLGLLPRPMLYSGSGTLPDNYADRITVAQKKDENSTLRFRTMASALTSLSKTFYDLSNAQKRPEFSRVRERCKGCFEAHCKSCTRNVICWDTQYEDTAQVLTNLATGIYSGEVATKDRIPDYLARRCSRIDEILSDINKSYAKELEDAIKGDKAEVFAIDYAAMSALLEDAIKENSKEYEIDEKLTSKLKGSARYLNFTAASMAVYGKRRKQIIAGGVDLARVKMGVDDIRRSFERVTGTPLTSPDFSVEKGYVTMTMQSARILSAEGAKATAQKENEVINGDSISFFENSEDYFYTLLGDGMGSGRDAALTSRLASVYLDRMLRSGNKKEQSIKMLNSFLRQKNRESFTTVDLLEIDLLSGSASFLKSGAAPSYVVRGTSIFKISSNTMPVGITKELYAEEVSFNLEEGDMIVMISDGISESFEDGLWLADMLTHSVKPEDELQDICDMILEEAKRRNNDRDDMTVGVIKVKSEK
ncbi:MAG: SpoIIE family protein phosphatase [Clostridia bacterium]|nr:SpoIIE family protein phosphatase [Clostridia bacterium]